MPLAVLLNPDDPIYNFEHTMRHREYFAVMHPLNGFSVLPYLLDPSQNTDQPAQSWNRNHQQAHNDFNSVMPGNYANGFTITNVVPPTFTGVATSVGTTDLILFALSGTIQIGSIMTPPGVTITSQTGGSPGGNGTYTTDQPTYLPAPGVVVSIAFPPYEQANPVGGNTFGIDAPGVLVEGNGGSDGNKAWWAFLNHQQHFAANDAILPLPTTAPTTAGTGPGQMTNISNPWWWALIAPINFPYW